MASLPFISLGTCSTSLCASSPVLRDATDPPLAKGIYKIEYIPKLIQYLGFKYILRYLPSASVF